MQNRPAAHFLRNGSHRQQLVGENEMTQGDALPVGIILCAQKNQALVHYATGGLSQQIFVSEYLLNLPSEEELRQIVEEEQKKAVS